MRATFRAKVTAKVRVKVGAKVGAEAKGSKSNLRWEVCAAEKTELVGDTHTHGPPYPRGHLEGTLPVGIWLGLGLGWKNQTQNLHSGDQNTQKYVHGQVGRKESVGGAA